MEEDDFSKVDSLIDVEKSLAGGVILSPSSGEKTLYGRPGIRGAFIGLRTDTDRADTLLYAVIEGLCFSLRELAEKMSSRLRLRKLKAVGGGSRSPSVDADSGQCAEYPGGTDGRK